MKKLLAVFLTLVLVFTSCLSIPGLETKAAEETQEENGINNTGKTYYVDADNGDDSNSGLSEKKAWKSIEKVNATTFEPGDAILLKRGCVWTDVALWPQGSGDENNQNYVSCYGDESADLPSIISRYADEIDNLPDYDTTVFLKNQNYWTIENLNLTNGSEGSGEQNVIKMVSTGGYDNRLKGIVIRNCILNGSNPKNWDKITKKGLTGISIVAYLDGVLIENNQVSNCKATGIYVSGNECGVNYLGEENTRAGQNVVIRNNYLENIGKDGIMTNNCYKPLVEYNVVNKSHSYAQTSAHVALWPFASYGALYQYNEAYNTQTVYDGQGFDSDYLCYNTTFQYNYSHDNVGGFMLICTEAEASWMPRQYAYNVGTTVRYNISQNDQHYTFNLTGGVQNTRIYNNTIYIGRNTFNATHYFFVFDKGTNKLTGLNYPDDVLVANNIFYSDRSSGNELTECSNLVFKNNLFCGSSQSHAIENGAVTTVTAAGAETYGVKESSGNIWNEDPLFVNPGRAGNGIDSCTGYYLYEGSPAIGAGVAIEDGFHACPNDYFGNAINENAVNIGAYAGTGETRPDRTYDEKYVALFDFEKEDVGANGKGTSGEAMSGIERCTEAKQNAIISSKASVQNANTSSTKCLALNNASDSTADASATFYVYPSEFASANGIRLWLNPNGEKTSYTVSFICASKTYSKTFTVQKTGWKVLTFNEMYGKETITPDMIRDITAIKVSANLSSGRTVYVDDIQVNNGEMDSEDIFTYAYDEADVEIVEDFETATETALSANNTYGANGSGPAYGAGITTYNGSKVFYTKSSSHANTAVSHGLNWTHTFENLTAALANDSDAEGIQLTMNMVGEDVTEEDLKKTSTWNQYSFSITSDYEVTYTKEDGTQVTSKAMNYSCSQPADSNNLVRIPFEGMYFTSGSDKIYLRDLDEEEAQSWKENIVRIWINYNTQGGTIGRTSDNPLVTYCYVDNMAVYKNEKHLECDAVVIKEATCTEAGESRKLCTNCGNSFDIETIPALGHDCEWIIVEEATEDEAGIKELTCKRCDEVLETQEYTLEDSDEESSSEETTEDADTPTSEDTEDATSEDTNAPTSEETTEETEISKTVVVGALKYKVISNTDKKRQVAVIGVAKKKTKKITIPATVKINKKAYTVTQISAKAFRKNKKITSVTIGKNVKAIGKEAFYGCSNLKKLTIKTTKLTTKNVKSKAFSKTYKKMKVSVPKKKKTSYKKLLKRRGISSKATIK